MAYLIADPSQAAALQRVLLLAADLPAKGSPGGGGIRPPIDAMPADLTAQEIDGWTTRLTPSRVHADGRVAWELSEEVRGYLANLVPDIAGPDAALLDAALAGASDLDGTWPAAPTDLVPDAVPQPLKGRMLRVPASYGDDSTDATTAIQNLLDLAKPGEPVYLPNGVFRVRRINLTGKRLVGERNPVLSGGSTLKGIRGATATEVLMASHGACQLERIAVDANGRDYGIRAHEATLEAIFVSAVHASRAQWLLDHCQRGRVLYCGGSANATFPCERGWWLIGCNGTLFKGMIALTNDVGIEVVGGASNLTRTALGIPLHNEDAINSGLLRIDGATVEGTAGIGMWLRGVEVGSIKDYATEGSSPGIQFDENTHNVEAYSCRTVNAGPATIGYYFKRAQGCSLFGCHATAAQRHVVKNSANTFGIDVFPNCRVESRVFGAVAPLTVETE